MQTAALATEVLIGDRAVDGLPRLEPLLRSVGAPVTARSGWLRCWAGSRDETPLLVLVSAGDRVVAGAPLSAVRRGPVLQVRAWGHDDSDQVCLPTSSERDAQALAGAVGTHLAQTARLWTLRVEQLPRGDRAGHALAAQLPRARLEPGDVSPRTAFGPERTLAKHLSRNGRRSALQAGNRLAAAGLDPVVAYERDPARVRVLLDDIEGLRRRRDHALGRPSALDASGRRDFYRSVVIDAAAAGELELATLHVQGRLVAYDVCLLDQGWVRLWDGRIEPDMASYGVGRLLDAQVLERALANPDVVGVDWMRGDEPYKSRSANERIEHEHLQASSSPLAWAVSFGPAAARSAARERVAEHPELLGRWRRIKSLALQRARRGVG